MFSFTGGEQSFVVPADVRSVTVRAYGAQGGNAVGPGGEGGSTVATIAVTAGETLAVFVGGRGTDGLGCAVVAGGFNGGGTGGNCAGGGGGGASDVRQGGATLADRVVVAAGGGGAGGHAAVYGGHGGAGGGTTGADGGHGSTTSRGGGGGTQSGGGAGGGGPCAAGVAGTLGVGGAGGSGCNGGGGGGGGYYGGGGGGDDGGGGGGGGGSSFAIASATGVSYTQGGHTGDGEVVISYRISTSAGSRVMVCLAAPQPRADGSSGVFFDVDVATWLAGVDSPGSIYYQSTPAIFVQGYGTMCRLSDLVTYGGDPAGYTDSGYLVNESGLPTPPGLSNADWGAAYEYYLPTG